MELCKECRLASCLGILGILGTMTLICSYLGRPLKVEMLRFQWGLFSKSKRSAFFAFLLHLFLLCLFFPGGGNVQGAKEYHSCVLQLPLLCQFCLHSRDLLQSALLSLHKLSLYMSLQRLSATVLDICFILHQYALILLPYHACRPALWLAKA